MSKHEITINGCLLSDPLVDHPGITSFFVKAGVWFKAHAGGQLGEFCSHFLTKGQEVFLTATFRGPPSDRCVYDVDIRSIQMVRNGEWVYEDGDNHEEGIPF